MAGRPSIWKKEIHLRKRPEPGSSPAAAAPEAKPSIWKRDLHLGRKDRPVKAPSAEPGQSTAAQPSHTGSVSADVPLERREPAAAVEAGRLVARPAAGMAVSEATPAVGLGAPSEQPRPNIDRAGFPPWGPSESQPVPAAPAPKHTDEPERVPDHPRAPLALGDDRPEAAAAGPYGWMDSTPDRSEAGAQTPAARWLGLNDEPPAPAASRTDGTAPRHTEVGTPAESLFPVGPEANDSPAHEPALPRWSDSAPDETPTLSADETGPRAASVEPTVIPASDELAWWSAPASPDVPPPAVEPPTGHAPGLPTTPPAEPERREPAGPAESTAEEREPGLVAPSPIDRPDLEWPKTRGHAEPAPPVVDWELAPPATEAPAVAEAVSRQPPAAALDQAAHAAPPRSKPGLLKRELRLPRSLRRPSRPPSLKASPARPIKDIVGLRVGSSQLAAAHVHNNGAAELVQLARTPLARGIVTGGEVRDPEALTGALKKFFAEQKLPRRGIRLGIASNRIGVRVLEVPEIDDPRLFENSIRFHAQETLPISVGDAIIDHVVLGPGAPGGAEPMVRILLVFAHRELVDRHVQACRRAGLKLEGIDFEAFALLRALGAPRPAELEPTRAVVAVAIGQERTIFAVSDGRVCDFTRVLEWGGGSLDISIARALNLTPSQAEPLKLELSLDGEAAPSQFTPEQAAAARAAIRTELQALSRELVSSLQFYQARPGSLDIGEIMLSGGGAQLDGLAAELERLIGVPVVTGDPFTRVEVGRRVGRVAEAGSLAIAIGLGIED